MPTADPDRARSRRVVATVLLSAHLALLIHLTLFRFGHPGAESNLFPFLTIRHDIRAGGDEFRINILGNLAAFAPIGFLLPTALGRRGTMGRVVGICFALSLLIETLQWFSGRRVADVDDLILNTAGGWIGHVAWVAGGWWFAEGPRPDQKA